MQISAEQLIDNYHMLAHPEGGFYVETYRSAEVMQDECLPIRFRGERVFSTAIYYLLRGFEFSSFHRISSDELWHFYYGGSLNIYVIEPSGNFELITLGTNISNGEVFQAVVKSGNWFAARPVHTDSFSFVGCTVAPGFSFEDFEIADPEKLSAEFPVHTEMIQSLSKRSLP